MQIIIHLTINWEIKFVDLIQVRMKWAMIFFPWPNPNQKMVYAYDPASVPVPIPTRPKRSNFWIGIYFDFVVTSKIYILKSKLKIFPYKIFFKQIFMERVNSNTPYFLNRFSWIGLIQIPQTHRRPIALSSSGPFHCYSWVLHVKTQFAKV